MDGYDKLHGRNAELAASPVLREIKDAAQKLSAQLTGDHDENKRQVLARLAHPTVLSIDNNNVIRLAASADRTGKQILESIRDTLSQRLTNPDISLQMTEHYSSVDAPGTPALPVLEIRWPRESSMTEPASAEISEKELNAEFEQTIQPLDDEVKKHARSAWKALPIMMTGWPDVPIHRVFHLSENVLGRPEVEEKLTPIFEKYRKFLLKK